jgi:hypothetical protein
MPARNSGDQFQDHEVVIHCLRDEPVDLAGIGEIRQPAIGPEAERLPPPRPAESSGATITFGGASVAAVSLRSILSASFRQDTAASLLPLRVDVHR